METAIGDGWMDGSVAWLIIFVGSASSCRAWSLESVMCFALRSKTKSVWLASIKYLESPTHSFVHSFIHLLIHPPSLCSCFLTDRPAGSHAPDLDQARSLVQSRRRYEPSRDGHFGRL